MATKAQAGGRRQFLTRSRVVAAGRRVAETEGVAGLTIRRVAAELGAAPMALYRHVKDKRELIIALLDDVAEGLPPLPGEEGTPQERVAEAFLSVDAYLARHVWVVEILREGELFAPRAGALFPWVLDRFGELGLTDEQGTEAYAALWWFVLGHLSYLPSATPERRAMREDIMVGVVPDPDRVRRVLRSFDHDVTFRRTLRALVDTLAKP